MSNLNRLWPVLLSCVLWFGACCPKTTTCPHDTDPNAKPLIAKTPGPEGARKTADPEDKSGRNAKAPLSCETLFSRHAQCIFQLRTSWTVHNLPVGNSPKKGATEPLLTIVEFSDFQCPACMNFSLVLLPKILEPYKDKVQLVFKHYPLDFHPLAMTAAIIAEEVRAQKGDAAFWKFHDEVFTSQKDLTVELLENAAKKLGVNMTKLKKAMTEEKSPSRLRVQEEMALGEQLKISGTPSLVINGVLFNSETDDLEALLNAELARAQAALDAGTPRAKLYSFLTDHGGASFERPVPQAEVDLALQARRPGFMKGCASDEDRVRQIVQIMSACSAPDISCETFMRCTEDLARKASEAE